MNVGTMGHADFWTAPCIIDTGHIYVPTGRGHYVWTAGDTVSPRPKDAPYFAKMKCMFCGVTREELSGGGRA